MQQLTGLRALVVEDEYFLASDLKGILQVHGAETVRLSGTVDDAVSQIRQDGFEFALLNINIRGEITFQLADELRDRGVPFAFVSGYDARSIPDRFEDVPNWGKPYDAAQIVQGIRTLCGRASA